MNSREGEHYGEERDRQVRYAEAFEICEYSRQPTAADLRTLFPFLPGSSRQDGDQTTELHPAKGENAAAKPILALWGTTGTDRSS